MFKSIDDLFGCLIDHLRCFEDYFDQILGSGFCSSSGANLTLYSFLAYILLCWFSLEMRVSLVVKSIFVPNSEKIPDSRFSRCRLFFSGKSVSLSSFIPLAYSIFVETISLKSGSLGMKGAASFFEKISCYFISLRKGC